MTSVVGEGEYNLANQREAMDALYDARIALGMPLWDMEKKSGISVNSFYAWRSGQRTPQFANLVALAETLGFEIVMVTVAPPHAAYCLSDMKPALKAIDEARRNENLSTKELQRKSSVATNSFYSWLRLQRDPTLTRFISLVELLGFRVVMRRKAPELAA